MKRKTLQGNYSVGLGNHINYGELHPVESIELACPPKKRT